LTNIACSPGMTTSVEFVLKSSSGCLQIRSSPLPEFLMTSVQCFFPPTNAFSFGFLPNSPIICTSYVQNRLFMSSFYDVLRVILPAVGCMSPHQSTDSLDNAND